jgi:uncharacterized protein YbaP (TraB family)
MSKTFPLLPRLAGLAAGLAFSFACSLAAFASNGAPENAAELAPASGLAVAGSVAHSGYATATRPAAQAGNGGGRSQGALYRITRGGETAYLFGTIHVGATSFYPLAPQVSSALAGAGRLVLELDIRANDAFELAVLKHASYPVGDHIRNHISPGTLRRLTAALHASGIPLSSVSHLKPWMLANTLVGLELARSGYARAHGNESFLLNAVQARGADVAELESADYQLSLFDTLGDSDAEAYLREALDELSSGVSMKKSKAVIDAWMSGDAAALDALMADTVGAGTVTSDFTRRTLLDRRNPEMAQRIEHILKDGTVSFVGVGLLHLLGEKGLPQLLSQRGYQVERMH